MEVFSERGGSWNLVTFVFSEKKRKTFMMHDKVHAIFVVDWCH